MVAPNVHPNQSKLYSITISVFALTDCRMDQVGDVILSAAATQQDLKADAADLLAQVPLRDER
jgi:hypothetical protein